jgi:hypothetical protein
VLELLRREGRMSYRAIKRRFSLDDEYLEDLKTEIIRAKRLAIDEDGAVLVWTGSSSHTTSSAPQPAEKVEPGVTRAIVSDEAERRRFTLDIAKREVCAEVRAVRTHYARDSCRPPIGDHSPAEEIDPYNFALGNFARQTTREPGFRKDSIFPLRRNRDSEMPTP